MNSVEAKQILMRYRPGSSDASDEQVAEALALSRTDADLALWLGEHSRFQSAMRARFREIPVPTDLKEKILAQPKIVRVSWFNSNFSRMAAAVVLFAGLCFSLFYFSQRARVPDSFADYKSRMVRSALREYHMDVVTGDLTQVRDWMKSHGAPADFAVPKRLSGLQLTGGGVLRWRNHPVSMVCYNRGDNEMLFLFVMDRSAVKDAPSATPELAKVSKLISAGWSDDTKTYLLAGPEEADFLQKYF